MMFKFEQGDVIIERSKSMRALYLVGGSLLTLGSAALLVHVRFIWVTTQESKPPLLLLSLLFVFVLVLGITAISQCGPYRLTLSHSTGVYKEETTRLGRPSVRTGPLSDFTSLKLVPLKNKDAGCAINLSKRGRTLFPIQLETYYDRDYSQARTDLHRISAATGIPAEDAGAAAI
jgi:hypothetical protein